MTVCLKVTPAAWSEDGHDVSLRLHIQRIFQLEDVHGDVVGSPRVLQLTYPPQQKNKKISHKGVIVALLLSTSSLTKRIRPRGDASHSSPTVERDCLRPDEMRLLGAVQWLTAGRWWVEGRGAAHRFNPVRKWIKILATTTKRRWLILQNQLCEFVSRLNTVEPVNNRPLLSHIGIFGVVSGRSISTVQANGLCSV